MSRGLKRVVVWGPRVLGLLFVAFISLFALDVFEEGVRLTDALIGLAIHLIPTYLILIGIAAGWKRPVWGGVILVGLAAVAMEFFDRPAGFIMVIPLLVVGALFVLSGWSQRRQEATAGG